MIKALIAPLLLLIATVVIDYGVSHWFAVDAGGYLRRYAVVSAIWLSLLWLTLRAIDFFIIHSLFTRRTGHAPPRLFTDLLKVVVSLIFIGIIASRVFDFPVSAIVTTSGVTVAVIGFALRDVLASLFAGIALNIERPHQLGDWLEVGPNVVGEVIEISWLSTRLRTRDRVIVVVPNSRLATSEFLNYRQKSHLFRESFTICIDQAFDPARLERIFLIALSSVPGIARKPAPDIKIDDFISRGVVWRLRYWIDDYKDKQDLRYAAMRAVMSNLYHAGVPLPHEQVDLHGNVAAPADGGAEPGKSEPISPTTRLLKRCRLLEDQGLETLEQLAKSASLRTARSGETIVKEGDLDRSLFILIEGKLEVFKRQGKDEVSVGELYAGDAFGEYALLTGKPRAACVRAATTTKMLEISAQTLQPILANSPNLAADLSDLLAERELATSAATLSMEAKHEQRLQAKDLFLQRIRTIFHL